MNYIKESEVDILKNIKYLKIRKKNIRLLDVGCCRGSFTLKIVKVLKKLYKVKIDVYGIDVDKVFCKKAKEKGIKCFNLDAGKEKYPFNKNFFDIVVSAQVLEHIYNTDFYLREIYRVLKDDGYLIISTPNLASLPNRLLLLFGCQPTTFAVSEVQVGNPKRWTSTNNMEHIHSFTIKATKDLLRYHNFEIIKKIMGNIYLSNILSIPLTKKIFPNLGTIQSYICKKITREALK